MRVLVVTNIFPTAAEPWRGCYVSDQVDDLRAAGVDVDVFAFDARSSNARYLTAIRDVRRLLRREPFDVVHAHYGLTGAVIAAQRRVPRVTTFHGSDTGFIRWQLWVSRVVARLTVPVVVDRRAVGRLKIRHAERIPCAVDADRFQPGDRVAARAALGWPADARIVLFPSNPAYPVKDHALFEETIAATRASGVEVVPRDLAGLSRDDVARAMRAADVVLLTSRSEGSPVAVREALASGTPVVGVDVGDVPDVLAGLPGCAVCPRDAGALAVAVEVALGVRDEAALRARALEYSRPETARRIIGLYERATGRTRGGSDLGA